MNKKLETIRTALADYMASEGCDCCQNTVKHNEAAQVLAVLLEVPMYNDGIGYAFYKFGSDEELVKMLDKS